MKMEMDLEQDMGRDMDMEIDKDDTSSADATRIEEPWTQVTT